MTDKQKMEIFCLTLICVLRKCKAKWELAKDETTDEDLAEILDSVPQELNLEVGRILMEHLQRQEIAELAAAVMTSEAAKVMRQSMALQMMRYGEFSLERLIEQAERFCKGELGREVKV